MGKVPAFCKEDSQDQGSSLALREGCQRTASGETFGNTSTEKQPTQLNHSEHAIWCLIPFCLIFGGRQGKNVLIRSNSHKQTFSILRDTVCPVTLPSHTSQSKG